MSIDLTPFFLALMGVLATIITAILILWIRENTSAKQQEALRLLIRTLVFAAEQIYGSSIPGAEKMQYVMSELRKRGYDVGRAAQAIEAMVYEMQNMREFYLVDETQVEE